MNKFIKIRNLIMHKINLVLNNYPQPLNISKEKSLKKNLKKTINLKLNFHQNKM